MEWPYPEATASKTSGLAGCWVLAEIETEALRLRFEAERGVETMGTVGGMALVREKLHFVAASRSGIGEQPAHDGRRDPFPTMTNGHYHGLDEGSGRAAVRDVRHDHQGRRSHHLAVDLGAVHGEIVRQHHP